MADSNLQRLDRVAALRMGFMLWILIIYFQTTQWTENLGITNISLIAAIGLGILLGRSNYSLSTVRIISISTALLVLPVLLSLSLDFTYSVWAGLFTILHRIGISISQLILSEPFSYTTVFLAFSVSLTWVVGFWGSYSLVKKNNPWIAIILASILLIIIDAFLNPEKRNTLITGSFVFFLLLLLSRVYIEKNRAEWNKKRIPVDNENGFNLNWSLFLLILSLSLMIWNFPTLIRSVTPATRENRNLNKLLQTIEDRFEDATAPLRGDNPRKVYGFGQSLALGQSISQDQQALLKVSNTLPLPDGMHYYWQAWIYDTYNDGVWQSRASQIKSLRPDEIILDGINYQEEDIAEFKFSVYQPLGVYLISGIPVSINSQADLFFSGTLNNEIEIHSLVPLRNLESGDEYTLRTKMTLITQDALRRAGTNYPLWVKQIYLQLPEAQSGKIHELAEEITQDADSPFDKALAITEYLRDTITYSDTLVSPPDDKDILEWFLFDYQKGFCNYSATAEVLLLRSIGIPSRLVNGYNEGELLNDGRSYLVRGKNAHAWPEVYFPGFGWVQFEPTSALPPQVYQEEKAVDVSVTDQSDSSKYAEQELPTSQRLEEKQELPVVINPNQQVTSKRGPSYTLLITVVLLACLLIFWISRKTKSFQIKQFPRAIRTIMERNHISSPKWLDKWVQNSEKPEMQKLYDQLLNNWRWLGLPKIPRGTPNEQLTKMGLIIPGLEESINKFNNEYEKAVYSIHKPDLLIAKETFNRINNLLISAKILSIIKKR